jgi:hypothetical protein
VLLGHIIPNHNQQLCTRKDILLHPVCPPFNMEDTLSTIFNLLNVEKSRSWVQSIASMSKLKSE